jgi:hypothetical protein
MACLETYHRQSSCKFGYMSKRCCFSYSQLAKETWIGEFTIDIFTGVGPLLGLGPRLVHLWHTPRAGPATNTVL